MLWIAYYDDNYLTYRSDKEGSGWLPSVREIRSVYAMRGVGTRRGKEAICYIDLLRVEYRTR